MRTILDDKFGTLTGIFPSQIGDTILGNNDIDRMFTVVEMRNHRDDGADFSSFCHRRTGEY